jgi:hypothetical protein
MSLSTTSWSYQKPKKAMSLPKLKMISKAQESHEFAKVKNDFKRAS